jgi:hypothetical protein
MREGYKKELAELKKKMEKAELFAAKFPFLEKAIIEHKWTGEETHSKLTDTYKDMYFGWGLYRTFYTYESSKENITNYRGEPYQGYLNHVYINTLSQYDCHENFGIEDICKKVPVFFFDYLNTRFYVEDAHLESFLNELNSWYLSAKEQAVIFKKESKRQQLEKQLAELTTNPERG